MATRILSRRALGRATLARQLLLKRHQISAIEAIERLAGMQAQAPLAPYVGLWTRLHGFQTGELATLLTERRVVRTALMRTTVHLVAAEDALAWRPLMQVRLDRTFSSTSWGQGLRDEDLDAIIAAGRALLGEKPLTRVKLSAALVARWPKLDPEALAYATTYRVPIVQVPPRGVWGKGGQATWTTYEAWLGRGVNENPSVDALVLRYLAAFGPASVKDAQAWCGLTRLGEVVERLRPRLKTFCTEAGDDVFDLPDAPRPRPDTPSPVRFLPEYDNLLLSYADRSRFLTKQPGRIPPWAGNGARSGTFLVDGSVAGLWDILFEGDEARLVIEPIDRLSGSDRAEAEVEGTRLLAFAAAGAASHDVRFVPPD